MTVDWPAISELLIRHSPIALTLLRLFFYFRIKRNAHPVRKAAGLLLLLAVAASWPHFSFAWPSHLALPIFLLHFFLVAAGLRFLLFEGGYGRILFGLIAVAATSNVVAVVLYAVLVDTLSLELRSQAMTLTRFSFLVLCLAAYPLVYRHLRPPIIRILDAMENEKWYVTGATTLIVFCLGYLAQVLFLIPPTQTLFVAGIMPVLSLIGFHLLLYNLIINRDQNCLLQSNLKSSRLLLQMYDHFNEEQARKEEAFRLMRHDFRHLLGHLEDLAESGDTESLRRYLEKMIEDLDSCAVRPYSEDRAVNAVVSYYFAQAAKNGTRCEAQVSGPEQSPLNDLETASLIGNALENCVKGAAPLGDRGRIAFRLKPVKDRLVFKFENTYQEGRYHQGEGLGLKSLRLICARHGGLMESTTADGWYQLAVILPRRGPEPEKEGK